MKLDTILSILLENARENWVISNMGPKLEQAAKRDRSAASLSVEQLVARLRAMDPSKNSQYLQWIAKQYVAGQFRLEDAYRVRDVVTKFNEFKPRLQQRDINKMDFRTLEQQIDDILSGSGDISTKDTPYDDVENVKYLYKGPLGILAVPKTKEASCELGRGTKWCTAANNNNMFDDYNRSGDLYVWIDRNGKKYQFWWDVSNIDLDAEPEHFVIGLDDMEKMKGFKDYANFDRFTYDEDRIKSIYYHWNLDDIDEQEVEQLMDERDNPISDDELDRLEHIPVIRKLFDRYRKKPIIEIGEDLQWLLDAINNGVLLDNSTIVNMIRRWPVVSTLYIYEMRKRRKPGVPATPEIVDALRAQEDKLLEPVDSIIRYDMAPA